MIKNELFFELFGPWRSWPEIAPNWATEENKQTI